ncbi:MAG: phage portal protein [Clostridia bacterium]|nr:phage portal protein [Clostridia bacterium]
MNIAAICDYLSNKLGFRIESGFHQYINQWADWYKGYHKPFHHYCEYNGKDTVELDRYSLKMAKKVCEDWANMLLNENTRICAEDPNADSFLKEVLDKNNFRVNANALIEKTFALGTGAFALRLEGYKISLDYITADCIIPINYRNGEITEVAFVSDVIHKGKHYTYIESHLTDEYGYYVINNEYLDSTMSPVFIDNKVVRKYETNSKTPWFVIIRPNITNNICFSSPMGISVYANAIDVLKGIDLAYDNLCTDFFLGGKMIMMNEAVIGREENGRRVAPQFSKRRLFMSVGDSIIDGAMYREYNPLLRVDENTAGINAQLNFLSSKCGLGERYYNFDKYDINTATQVMSENSTLFRTVKKHELVLERALINLCKVILEAGGFKDSEISVIFDDSIIEDTATLKAQDRNDVSMGIMQKYEYRMKYYGENEETARKKVTDTVENT